MKRTLLALALTAVHSAAVYAHCDSALDQYGTCNPNSADHHHHPHPVNGGHIPGSELPIIIGGSSRYTTPVKRMKRPAKVFDPKALWLFGGRELHAGGGATQFEHIFKQAITHYHRQYNHDGRHRYLEQQVIQKARRYSGIQQLQIINDALNAVPYADDEERFGDEYVTNPVDYVRFGGDCDDNALAKYIYLRALGWPATQLRVVSLTRRQNGSLHATLVVLPGKTGSGISHPVLLDNGAISTRLINPEAVTSYAINYAFNEQQRWSYSS